MFNNENENENNSQYYYDKYLCATQILQSGTMPVRRPHWRTDQIEAARVPPSGTSGGFLAETVSGSMAGWCGDRSSVDFSLNLAGLYRSISG